MLAIETRRYSLQGRVSRSGSNIGSGLPRGAGQIRAQIVRRDFERGACEDLSQQERNPVVKSLQRVIGR